MLLLLNVGALKELQNDTFFSSKLGTGAVASKIHFVSNGTAVLYKTQPNEMAIIL